MTDDPSLDETHPAKLFGDPRSALVERGPDRRAAPDPLSSANRTDPVGVLPEVRPSTRGDAIATALAVLGVLVFGTTIIAGSLILYNAKNVGAFRNPWDSTRVAIGLAVFALGVVQSAVLIGLARTIAHLRAAARARLREGQ